MQQLEISYNFKMKALQTDLQIRSIIEDEKSRETITNDVKIKKEPALEIDDLLSESDTNQTPEIKTDSESILDNDSRQNLEKETMEVKKEPEPEPDTNFSLSALQDMFGEESGEAETDPKSGPQKAKRTKKPSKNLEQVEKEFLGIEDFDPKDKDFDPKNTAKREKKEKTIRGKKALASLTDKTIGTCPYCAEFHKNLKKHIHTEHTNFKCKICKRLFLTKSYLAIHMEKNHAFQNKTHVCFMSDCRVSFAHEDELREHVDRIHLKLQKPFECPECKMRFAQKPRRNAHCRKQHNLELQKSRIKNRDVNDLVP
jgi:hypothetical protein